MSDVIQILVDTIQQRIKDDSISCLVGSRDWDTGYSTNFYMDGVTGTAFLCPAPWDGTGSWQTSNAGIYQKLPPTDYTFNPASSDPNWIFPIEDTDGAPYNQYNSNPSGSGGITNYNVAVNQAIVVECYIPPGTASSQQIINAGWGSSGDYTTGVSVAIYANGNVEIYKEGTFLSSFTLAGQNSDYGQTDNQIPGQTQDQYILFLLIPCRERELLILSSNGGGASYIFADIPEGTPGATITPAAPIWFGTPAGVVMPWRLALLQYPASGNAISKQTFWRYDPGAAPTGGFQSYIDTDGNYWDGTGGPPSTPYVTGGIATGSGNTVVADGITPTSAYANNTNGVSLNIAFVGGTQSSGTYTVNTTSFIYGARGYTLDQYADTTGTSLDLAPYALSFGYEASDSIAGTRCNLIVKDPLAIIAAGAPMIDAQTERPWQVYDSDGTQILEGLNESPKLKIATYIDPDTGLQTYGDTTNLAEEVTFGIRDGMLMAENFVFKEPIPGDGLSVAAFYTLVTDTCGITNSAGGRSPNLSADLSTTYLPAAGNPTNDFNTLIKPGDKASDWMDRIVKTYCGNYFHGLYPMDGWNQPWLLAEADMPSTAAFTYYDCAATAVANSVDPTPGNLFRTCDVQMFRPEANDIYIQGFDYRTRRPILCHQFDSTNADPTVAPGSRLPPWRGSRVSYCWNDPTLADIDTCEYVMGLLFPRLTTARSMIEFEADFNSGLLRGQLVKLVFADGGGVRSAVDGTIQNPVTARIKTISARAVAFGSDGKATRWLPTRYIAQVGTDPSNLNVRSGSLASIAQDWLLRTVSKTVQWAGPTYAEIWRRPLIVQNEV